jgi:hypothetical protein
MQGNINIINHKGNIMNDTLIYHELKNLESKFLFSKNSNEQIKQIKQTETEKGLKSIFCFLQYLSTLKD